MLNLFQGGPAHNRLVETEDLMKPAADVSWIASYAWTPEIIVGSATGREARVWSYKEMPDEDRT